MTTYLIRRSLQGLVVLSLSTVIIYFLLCQVPGSPASIFRQRSAIHGSHEASAGASDGLGPAME